MKNILSLAFIATLFFTSCKNNSAPKVDAEFEKQLQEKFINAKEGDVIELPEGTFTLNRSLISFVNNLRG